jgi:hypothetical protein
MRHFATYEGFTTLDIMVEMMSKEGGLGGKTFSDMETPFFVTTSGLNDGQARIACAPQHRAMFESGENDGEYRQHRVKFLNDDDMPVVEAVRISASLPSIIKPVRMGDRILVDGGVTDNSIVAAARIIGKDGKKQPVAGWRLGYKGQNVEGLDNIAEYHLQMLDILTSLKDEDAINSCSLDGVTFRGYTANFFRLGMMEALTYAPELEEYMERACERLFTPFMRRPGNPMDNYLAPWSREQMAELASSQNMKVERDGKKPSDIISIVDNQTFVPSGKSATAAPAQSKLNTKLWMLGLMKDAWGLGWTAYYASVGWITVTFFQKKRDPRA